MIKDYKNMNIDEFQKTLGDTPWWVTNIFDDVDDVANAWELLYKGAVDDYLKPGLHVVGRIVGMCLRPCPKEHITALQVSIAKISCERRLLSKTCVTM